MLIALSLLFVDDDEVVVVEVDIDVDAFATVDFACCWLILHVDIPILFNKRQESPHILSDYPLEHIYNFDESGLMCRMLATSGNIIVAANKERRGAKLAKDRITIGNVFNATGSDFWKP